MSAFNFNDGNGVYHTNDEAKIFKDPNAPVVEYNFKKTKIIKKVIRDGDLNKFKKLLDPKDNLEFFSILIEASGNDNFQIFKHLLETKPYHRWDLADLIDEMLDVENVSQDRILMIEYIFKQYGSIGRFTAELIIQKNIMYLFEILIDICMGDVWKNVIVYGRSNMIEYLESKNKDLPSNSNFLFDQAIKSGNIDMVNYVSSKGITFTNESFDIICRKSVSYGSIDWESNSNILTEEFTLKVADLLIKNNYPLDESLCAKAAKKGKLYLIKFLREKGCSWDKYVFINSMLENYNYDLDIISYAMENNCPCDTEVLQFAERMSWDLHEYLEDYYKHQND